MKKKANEYASGHSRRNLQLMSTFYLFWQESPHPISQKLSAKSSRSEKSQKPADQLPSDTIGQMVSGQLVRIAQTPSGQFMSILISQKPSEELPAAAICQKPSGKLTALSIPQKPSGELPALSIGQKPSDESSAMSENHLGVPLFSLKGWNKKAQGIALGPGRSSQAPSPERAKQLPERLVLAPFQGKNTAQRLPPQGVALGCFVRPLRGIKADGRLRPIKLTLPKDANIYASQYQHYLPAKEDLRRRLMKWTAEEGAAR